MAVVEDTRIIPQSLDDAYRQLRSAFQALRG